MERSTAVREGILRFYDRFTAADTGGFAEAIADCEGVSVIGSAPGEGHEGREDWIATYDRAITQAGIELRGEDPTGYREGSIGWGVDRASFVMPDGGVLRTRLTAILREQDGDWKIVHLHFSVGVPDEQAIERPG